MREGKINLVMDGQWGSTGKGKLAGYLALKYKPVASVCNFLTNAGHWFRSKQYGDFLVQQLPMAAVNPSTELFIAANSAITMDVFNKEVATFENAGIPIKKRLHIHPYAVIILPEYKKMEAESLGKISSTLKGCGVAQMVKIQRKNVVLAKDIPELASMIDDDIQRKLVAYMERGQMVLGELAQGFDLSLNHGFYPHVTSRDVTPMSFMNDAGLPFKWLGDVYGVLRTFPIRVGNVYADDGTLVEHSGPIHGDQTELTWENVSMFSGKQLTPERTTVTNKIRRVFTFSYLQYAKFVRYCDPTRIMLNFCNYFPGIDERSTYPDLMNCGPLRDMVQNMNQIGPAVTLFGTGADNDQIIELSDLGG